MIVLRENDSGRSKSPTVLHCSLQDNVKNLKPMLNPMFFNPGLDIYASIHYSKIESNAKSMHTF